MEVTAVQTLVPVAAANLSGEIDDCVIRSQTAVHCVPGGRQVTAGQQSPSGAAAAQHQSSLSEESHFHLLSAKDPQMKNFYSQT